MRRHEDFNADWTFAAGFDPEQSGQEISGARVDLPHSAVPLPYSYCDETAYQRVFTYQKVIDWEPAFEGQDVALRFEAAMANAEVYLNGHRLAGHADGYTPFEVRLTAHLQRGANLITVKVDGAENPDIPPFGGRIDYLTYAGLYRDVALIVRPLVSIANMKIETPDALADTKSVTVDALLDATAGAQIDGRLRADLLDPEGAIIATEEAAVRGPEQRLQFEGLTGLSLWTLDAPVLYALRLTLETAEGTDSITRQFGFRTAVFSADGFALNGEPVKLIGLNRHQAFPYAGYALGRAAQERDAEILKQTLCCNVVRTSHYPQCPWFLDHCDRIGLLVLTEIPGWQHIGGAQWQAEALRNVERMITRDWNHPSIITWGVRINESDDDHDFYTATNALARRLDSTRQTSGIRKHAQSEFLEDIYTMNDFVQGGEEISGGPQRALKSQGEQTGLNRLVPYMVTECNGHMFPTKSFDNEHRQIEHVMRHLNVINQAHGDAEIAGVIGWCMFDYNTHKDFGSGDRICHHGVLDMFREPKFAAYAYASQGDPEVTPVLKPVTFYARGERNIGGVLPLMVLTNAEVVELRFPDGAVRQFHPARDRFAHLPYPPVIIARDDVGADAFGKWGMAWQDLEIAGIYKGKEIASVRLCADPLPSTLAVLPDKLTLDAAGREDLRVMVRALDQAGNKLPFLADQIGISVTGPAALIGPESVPLIAGSTGFWIRAAGPPGDILLRLTSSRFAPQEVSLRAL